MLYCLVSILFQNYYSNTVLTFTALAILFGISYDTTSVLRYEFLLMSKFVYFDFSIANSLADRVFNHFRMKILQSFVAIPLNIKSSPAIRPRLAYFLRGGRSPSVERVYSRHLACSLAFRRPVLHLRAARNAPRGRMPRGGRRKRSGTPSGTPM